MFKSRVLRTILFVALCVLLVPMAFGQQTGSISGRVTTSDGSALPGVTVEARSNVLPQPRVTVSGSSGEYRLPALQPGAYTLTFSLSGMQTATRRADVLLSQDTSADVKLGVGGLSENITVTAAATLVDKTSTAIQSGLSTEQIQSLPVGQEYRDLIKLIPGVQYTQDSTRGPSAGGNGQDNVYQLDGVNVTLPLYGTLSAEPASFDIAQVTTIKGGAKAIDFNRSGGFTIDSVSKSGTNKFMGQLSAQTQRHSFSSDLKRGTNTKFDQDRNWLDLNLGGPILADRLFFYGSYYRPTITRNNQSNLYGSLPKYTSNRNEEFGKLTFTPTGNILINGSYRNSKHTEKAADTFGAATAASVSGGSESTLKIGTLEGSWVINPKSFGTFKFTDFRNTGLSRPDNLSSTVISTAPGTKLDINNLDQVGRFFVPVPKAGNAAFNDFAAPLIAKYGYDLNGVRTGGGIVGFGNQLGFDNFFRKNGQVGYNLTLGSNVTNDLHFGYQRYTDTEELQRFSNGWGTVQAVGGIPKFNGTPVYYTASFLQASLGAQVVNKLKGDYQSQSFELNDTIHMGNWSFNLGVIDSQDTLYGQGLQEDKSTLSGYTLSPGNKYKMYQVPFKKMIQPRLGATWAYNGQDTVYASVARYTPAASSLPRAASWDRNYISRGLTANFDAAGNLIGVSALRASSGKLFVPNMDPRQIKEYLIGTSQEINNRWSARLYGRYRHGDHFWEDTNNTARVDYNPPAGIPRTPYIPDLNDKRAQIAAGRSGVGGSSYVIAELDGAFTKYYEATTETEWRGEKMFFRGSYTWSHYYGNFDQDNTGFNNDDNLFIGSSFISDGPGRQLWDFKYGNLRGDRRHMVKLYGSYSVPWNASIGAYAIYQSGQPWEAWDASFYNNFSDNDDTDRSSKFVEPAGSRRSPAHHQLDLNYTQNIPLMNGLNLQLVGDFYNIYNKQTGYSYQPDKQSPLFGTSRLSFDPRRFQLAARVQF